MLHHVTVTLHVTTLAGLYLYATKPALGPAPRAPYMRASRVGPPKILRQHYMLQQQFMLQLTSCYSNTKITYRVDLKKLKAIFPPKPMILTPPRSVFQVFLGNHRVFSLNLKSSC